MEKQNINVVESFKKSFIKVRDNTTGSVVLGNIETYYDEFNAPILNIVKVNEGGVYRYEFLYDSVSFLLDSKKGIRYATEEESRQRSFN